MLVRKNGVAIPSMPCCKDDEPAVLSMVVSIECEDLKVITVVISPDVDKSKLRREILKDEKGVLIYKFWLEDGYLSEDLICIALAGLCNDPHYFFLEDNSKVLDILINDGSGESKHKYKVVIEE